MGKLPRLAATLTLVAASLWWAGARGQVTAAPQAGATPALFEPAEACIACHTDMVTPAGEDVSFGPQWRASMMGNAARDPYWQAAVRREVTDHPQAQAHIEDECSACHMPMTRYQAKLAGQQGQLFAHLPVGRAVTSEAVLAADGVSCSACHQISAERLGERASFTGGFLVDAVTAPGQRRVYGPFAVDRGRTRIMHSASGFLPTEATHLASSEMCATCHTLITQAFGPDGQVVGELPEQVPYLEWQHSAYRTTRSCQDCHMPEVAGDLPVTPVWGEPRSGVSRHAFRGGNSFMTRLLMRFRAELGVTASTQELDGASVRTLAHLESESAQLSIARAELAGGRLLVEVAVENLAGHKLPTAYPSRRAWLHLTVRDRDGALAFESGHVAASGAIAGNDNDDDATRFEPHHTEITSPDQVQIYESVMADVRGAVTTGLLSAVRYVKDNRLLPHGFDKSSAPDDVAVHGAAVSDADFTAGGDRVRYVVSVAGGGGPYRVNVALCYQAIGYRWAENLRGYDAFETRRFVRYYESMSADSVVRLATASALVP